MRKLLMPILLGGGIVLTSVGVHKYNIICVIIAGFMIGIYSALIQNK